MLCGSLFATERSVTEEEIRLTNLKISLDLDSADEYCNLEDLNLVELISRISNETNLKFEVNCKKVDLVKDHYQAYLKIAISGNGNNQSVFLKRINQLKQSVKSFYNI